MKIAVFVSGSGTNLQALIDRFHNGPMGGVEIAIVLSDRRNAYALKRAKKVGIPTEVVRVRDFPDRVAFDAEIARIIDAHDVELIVLAGFMKLFQPPFVQRYRNRIINIHPSLLPAFPGAHPVQDTLAYGVKMTGVTVFFVNEGVDAGPIIAQVPVPIYDNDNEEQLLTRIHAQEHQLYPQVIQWYAEGKLEIIGRKVIVKE